MNILITSAGRRVSLVQFFQNELKKVYPKNYVFATDMQPELSPACNISHKYFKVRPINDSGYISELLAICRVNDIRLVIPTLDTELLILARNKHTFLNEGVHVIVSDEKFVDACRDKRKISSFFIERGIPTPAQIDRTNPTFPLFIKPYDGSLSIDTFHIQARDELTDYHMTNPKLLFMEYMDHEKNDEYTVDMYFDKMNQVKCIVPRKRIMVRAGEINKGVTVKNSILKFLKEKLHHIDGAIGCLTVQVFLNRFTERITGIEINPRFGGGYPLSYYAGANYPLWLIQEYYLNKKIEYTEDWENQLLMLRYDDQVLIHGYQS